MTSSSPSPAAPAPTSATASYLGFAEFFDGMLSGPEATAVLQVVARAVGAALVADGYLPEEWVSRPSPQFDYVRQVRIHAPFRDPSTNGDYMATVRMFVSDFDHACVWVDLCRQGETSCDRNSVSRLVLVNTRSDVLRASVFLHEMALWSHDDNANATAKRAGDLVADLTAILAP